MLPPRQVHLTNAYPLLLVERNVLVSLNVMRSVHWLLWTMMRRVEGIYWSYAKLRYGLPLRKLFLLTC